MPKPVLLAVDRDPDVVGALKRELGRRYADDYRIEVPSSGPDALATLERLAGEDADVALVLWGDCGYDIEETDVLERVRRLHPDAKRALLVPWLAWADSELSGVILRSMAGGRIDYYVLKPVKCPDELFHERVSNFLYEWSKARSMPAYVVRVVDHRWSRRSYEVRDLLQRNGVPNAFCDASSPEGRELRARLEGDERLPLVVFPNDQLLADPSDIEVTEAIGLSVDARGDDFDVVVIGSGPAGLSAAVYGASEGLATLVVEQHTIGGQAGSSSLIRNYLGFPRGISGAELAGQAYQQAWIFGAQFALMRSAVRIERADDRLAVTLSDGTRVTTAAIVLATGASYRRLEAEGVDELQGAGVYYGGGAAEARLAEDEQVYIVGGANSAGQAALDMARHAREVTLLVRGQSLRAGMSRYLVDQIEAVDNIRVRLRTTVMSAEGEGRLERLTLHDAADDREQTVSADRLLVLIGARPHTDWLPEAVARDARGFVLTGADVPPDAWPLDRSPLLLESSMPGLFVAGDVRHGSVKRVASGVGEGSIAIQLVHALAVAERLEQRAPSGEAVRGGPDARAADPAPLPGSARG